MRLLIVTDHTFHLAPDGVYNEFCFDRAFYEEYTAVFDEVVVAARMSRHEPPPGSSRADGPRVHFLPMEDVHGARWVLQSPTRFCPELPRAVASSDAVSVRIPSVAAIAASNWARRRGIPVMFELVGDPVLANRGSGLVTRMFGHYLGFRTRGITRRAAVGAYVNGTHLRARYPAGPGTVVEPVSDLRLPRSMVRPPRTFPVAPRPLRILTIGSLLPVKDQGTLLRAFAELRTRLPAHLGIVGDGERGASLRALAERLGIGGSVTFHGHVADRARIFSLLGESDLFVLTSITEGMPRALLEALAQGLPAIGTDTGGIAELLAPEQLVPVGDHARLASLLATAADDRERLEKWARAGHERVLEFTAEVLAPRRRRLLQVLHSLALEAMPQGQGRPTPASGRS